MSARSQNGFARMKSTPCTVRHLPNSEARRKCPTCGPRPTRRLAAQLLTLVVPLGAPDNSEVHVRGLKPSTINRLLRNRALAGYDRQVSIDRLRELATDNTVGMMGMQLALLEEDFETSALRALLISEVILGARTTKTIGR